MPSRARSSRVARGRPASARWQRSKTPCSLSPHYIHRDLPPLTGYCFLSLPLYASLSHLSHSRSSAILSAASRSPLSVLSDFARHRAKSLDEDFKHFLRQSGVDDILFSFWELRRRGKCVTLDIQNLEILLIVKILWNIDFDFPIIF